MPRVSILGKVEKYEKNSFSLKIHLDVIVMMTS